MERYSRYILLSLLISLPEIVAAQWQKFQLFDETVIYKSIHVAADTFYVSGGTGLYGTFDAGNTWIKHNLEGFVMLNDINFFNSKVGVGVGSIGGNSATTMKTFNGGETWTIIYVNNNGTVFREINDVEFIDKLNGYAVGRNKIVIKTTDGGNTWTNLNPNAEANNTGIKMAAVNQGYIVSPNFIQGFDGLSITETKLVGSQIVDLKVIDNKTLIAASSTKISKSSNGGDTWTHFTFPYNQINAMFVLNQQKIYVGTDNGLYISTDGGVSWEIFKETQGTTINSIVINPDGKGLALSSYGDGFRTDNFGGASVPIVSFDLSQKQYCNASSLIFTATNTRANYSYLWLINDQPVSTNELDSVRFTTNSSSTVSLICSNGVASDTLTQTININIIEVKANAGNDVYACSNEPVRLVATGGTFGSNFNWTPSTGLSNPNIQTPVATNLNTIEYVLSASYGSCISKDTVVIFRDPPVTTFEFKRMNIDTAGWIPAIQMIDENVGYALGQNDLYKTIDGGINWVKTFRLASWSSAPIGDVQFLSKDVGYFGLLNLYKTTDGGKTATEAGYFGHIFDLEFLSVDVGYLACKVIGEDFSEIWKLENGTWTKVYSVPGDILKIKCFPSGRCVATGRSDNNVVFLYSDDGTTWRNAVYSNVISPQFEADISFIDDTNGYATGGTYIWKTGDGGKSWNAHSQLRLASALDYFVISLFPTHVTFIDNQNGFALGGGQLFRTVNGGGCWENLGKIADAPSMWELYISENKKIFIGANGPSFASQSIYQADFLLPRKRDQTIEFSIQSPTTIIDGPFTLGAVASSTLPVTYEVSDSSIVSISGDVVTTKNPGVVQITAKQVGNESFNPAPPVSRSLTIIKVPQEISFTLASPKLVTDLPFDLVGSSSSGLPVAYSTSNESVISISGDKAMINNAGTVQITATQGGDHIFDVAQPVVQDLEVKKVQQSIVFDLPAKQYGDPDFALDATSDAGLPITYSIDNYAVVDLINGNIIRIKAAGNTDITATAPSTAIYYESSVTKNLEISPITGIEELRMDKSVIYPNPADKVIEINLAEFTNSSATITVYDMFGRDLCKITTAATEKIPVDISNFQSGIYFVKIIDKTQTQILKFMKR